MSEPLQLPPGGEAVTRARAATAPLVERGEWERVREVLAGYPDALAASGELTALYGEVLLRTGFSEPGRSWLQDAIPELERRGERHAVRRAMNLLGVALLELGRLEEATVVFERVADAAGAGGDDLLLAKARNNLGLIANIQGRGDHALALYQLAVPAYQRLGSAVGLAECYHNMAITFRDQLVLDTADEYEQRAIEFAREAGSQRLTAVARLGRAEISLRRASSRWARSARRWRRHPSARPRIRSARATRSDWSALPAPERASWTPPGRRWTARCGWPGRMARSSTRPKRSARWRNGPWPGPTSPPPGFTPARPSAPTRGWGRGRCRRPDPVDAHGAAPPPPV